MKSNQAERKSIAQAVIEKHQQVPPVDVTAIARDLGIRVWEMTDLPPGISGKIFRDRKNGGTSGYSIGVNASDAYVRKRFTVAHEIAHYVLHKEKIGEALSDDELYRSGLPTREEVEANRFAAQILMPANLIVQLKLEGCDDPIQMAQRLKVSGEAMRIRLSYL